MKNALERLSVKSVARSVGLPLACLSIGLCGSLLLWIGASARWFQNLSGARVAALASLLGTARAAVIGFGDGWKLDRPCGFGQCL